MMSFLEYFEAQVERAPHAIALSFEDRALSYADLNAQANRVARHLVEAGVPENGLVAVLGERSIELMVAVLGVLKAGAGYLPLDTGYPAERLRFMLEDSRAAFLIRVTNRSLELPEGVRGELVLHADDPVLTEGDASKPNRADSPSSLAYAIYTSGSTGQPKGVLLSRRSLSALITWQLTDSKLGEGAATLQFAPLSFDVHFQEMFGTWCSGGRLVLVREELRLEALRLLELIESERIERLFLPFIALQSLADIAVTSGKLPATVREVITAGEQLQITRALAELFSRLPETKLFNHYGPSETHVVTSLLLTGPASSWPALPSIGFAPPHVQLAILAEDGSPVARGQEGELWIGGPAVAEGYLYRPELTAQRFVVRDGVRFYRSGDLVQQRDNGEIQFLGRMDGQVKVRGYRIELGEIEVALASEPGVREAAVRVVEPAPGDKRIVGYLVVDAGTDIQVVRAAIAARLPEYMVPSSLVTLPDLPRTPSGKVDKRALPSPTRQRPVLSSEYAGPRGETERVLSRIWSEVLAVDGVGTLDNFFELGGNSLLALRAVAAIEGALGRRLPIVRFFEGPTIAAQAAYLEDPSASGRGRARGSRASAEGRAGAPIAIIGAAGRFPSAASVAELWANLRAGLDGVQLFSDAELSEVPREERDNPLYVKRRGTIEGARCFDARFFGVSPTEAVVLDPQQRILLELAWNALEDAGYAPDRVPGVVGVYAGTGNNSYFQKRVQPRPDAIARVGTFATMLASEKDYVATRIAHKLDLTGPALSIHTACSTSLVAIATAVEQLRAGRCDLALAGGASLTVPERSGHVYEEGGMFSRDGHTRSFDADASGTVFSDGAALLVLKPLADALADRDHVIAVISGVGLNNDGGGKASFTAPSVRGQSTVIAQAQRDAGVRPSDIQYVETHGTATPVGDPIEVEALTQAFREGGAEGVQYCGIGSIKSNLGHLTAAAGVAGVLKVALSLANEELPATVHFKAPNPKIPFAESPFFVVAERRAWPRTAGVRRLAGVSSFGVGGTNAHVILEEAPVQAASGPSIGPQLLVVSAKTEESLRATGERIGRRLATDEGRRLPLADVSFTLSNGRTAQRERAYVVASSTEEAARKLIAGEVTRGRAAPRARPVAFLFPGQGAQYVGMGKSLYESEPRFRLIIDQCAEILRPLLSRDLREVLYHPPAGLDTRALLKQTEITQSALFMLEYALARTWMSWGVQPTALVGHSVGELVAACLAGVFELEAALALVAARGQLMQGRPSGAMLSVREGRAKLAEFLPSELDFAAENSPLLSVIAGPAADITRYQDELTRRGIAHKLLETSHAFHSRSMDEAVVQFRQEVARHTLKAPKIPIVSTATGTWLTPEQAQSADYWASHMRKTVRFAPAMATLKADPDLVLLEVGPRKTLTTLAAAPVPGEPKSKHVVVASLGDSAEDDVEWTTLLTGMGRMWLEGVPVDFAAFFESEQRQRVSLPGTVFAPDVFWLDVPTDVRPVLPVARPDEVASFVAPPAPTPERIVSMPSRRERLNAELKTLFEQVSGLEFQGSDDAAHFVELGVDSLLVTQLALRLKQTYRVPVTFRQLMEDVPSFGALASYLDASMPPDAEAPAATAAAPVASQGPVPVASPMPIAAPAMVAFTPSPALAAGSLGMAQQLIQLQMAQLGLFQQQLALLAGSTLAQATPPATQPSAPPPSAPQLAPLPTAAVAAPVASAAVTASPTASAGEAAASSKSQGYDPKTAFGAIARIYKQSDEMTPQQQARLSGLVQRYTAKTKQSKAHTAEYRPVHADPRVVTGFKPRIKEVIYPIVTQRSEGCRLWDLDGNEYVDALNGFGSNFFGYSSKRIAAAMHRQIDTGIEIGPQTPLAGQCARLLCELTGLDRAAFCNTGSEAVMGALRIARTMTGRSLVVAFSGSYHGIFDEVIVRDTKNQRPIPAAPGIMPEAVHNMLILEYGTDKSLEVIRQRADEIAAVLVEPVQSRRPDFQPRAFLEEVRAITRASGTALIFDEVITGFRAAPGGAQAHFGIEADLATYGKIVGAGMPIGVIAGRNPWMDALDGGQWQYGDASIPTTGVTYFAGTFVRHPLAMAAVHEALTILKEEGPALQARVNGLTTLLATELNQFFASVGAPLEIRHFASLWKTFFLEPQPYGELLFCYLRDLGIHIWDGFPCFLTMAHGEAEVRTIIQAFQTAVREMQAGQFLPGGAKTEAKHFDASKPPQPGARLGRDPQGNPAWFVADPHSAGKYVQCS